MTPTSQRATAFATAGGAPEAQDPGAGDTDLGADREDGVASPWPRRLLVAAIFLTAAMAMVRRTPSQLSHRLLGNLGDPALIIWTLRWDGHALLHNLVSAHPLSIFNANIYAPAKNTLAYADDLISIAPVYNALYAVSHNWTLSLNVLWLGELGLNMGATYSLTRWLTRRTEAAIFAGLACGFSAFVWSQIGHPQLELVGLIPLGLLMLLKLLDRPTMRRAVAAGLVNVFILLAVQYWAAIYVVSVIVVLIGWLIVTRGRVGRQLLVALAVAAVITLVAVPTYIPYHDVEAIQGKRPLAPVWGLRPKDVLRATPGSYLYRALSVDDGVGAGERHLFPGFFTMALALLGLVSLAISYRRTPEPGAGDTAGTAGARAPPRDRRIFVILLIAVGLTAAVLGVGALAGGEWTPWRFFYDHVPGFAGIRVTARLGAVSLMVGAVLAGVGLDALLRRLRHPALRTGLTAVACIVVLAELAGPLAWTTLPSDPSTLAVYHALSHQPAGTVLELPIADPSTDTNRWSYTEPPRMVWATIDWHPRLNGYSGYLSPTYVDDVEVLATLPAPPAIARLRRRDIRYLILHTGIQAGFPMYTDAQAQAVISGLPAGSSVARYGPNYLVDLGP
jgi:hypothetical protein